MPILADSADELVAPAVIGGWLARAGTHGNPDNQCRMGQLPQAAGNKRGASLAALTLTAATGDQPGSDEFGQLVEEHVYRAERQAVRAREQPEVGIATLQRAAQAFRAVQAADQEIGQGSHT